MGNLNASIPDLKIEHINDGIGEGLILLEQDSNGNIDRVAIHPLHLRYMAEQYGLIETSNEQDEQTITTLKRRIKLLQRRFNHLSDCLARHADRNRADLNYEITFAAASADLANEVAADTESNAGIETFDADDELPF